MSRRKMPALRANGKPWQRPDAAYRLKMSAAPVSSPIPVTGRLSADIARVLVAFAEREVTLGEIVTLMHQRAYSFVLLLAALPFCTPIPLPGLSTPFGLVIAFIGLRIACGMRPWLPKRMLALRLPPKWLPKMFRAAEKFVRWLERVLRPCLPALVRNGVARQLHGAMIMICGLLLLLPLPVPFTNFFPAVAIVLLACAMMEGDGRFSIAGAAFFLAALAYFGLLAFGGAALAGGINAWWKSLFG
jgi:hypothetical protein